MTTLKILSVSLFINAEERLRSQQLIHLQKREVLVSICYCFQRSRQGRFFGIDTVQTAVYVTCFLNSIKWVFRLLVSDSLIDKVEEKPL